MFVPVGRGMVGEIFTVTPTREDIYGISAGLINSESSRCDTVSQQLRVACVIVRSP